MMDETTSTILACHRELGPVTGTTLLAKGFSSDRKHVLHTAAGPAYLLRLADSKSFARQKLEYDVLALHHGRGVACPKPLAVGTLDGQDVSYLLTTFLPGADAEETLPRLPPATQYDLGLQAGRLLARLHEVPGTETTAQWFERRRAKLDRNLRKFRELGLQFAGQARAERYIAENIDLLRTAPVRFQHDDFHPANLVVDGDRLAGVIDFSRADYGDPLCDFYKVTWFGVPVSLPFARGQIVGYLEATGMPAEVFFRRYTLHVVMQLHTHLVWEHWRGVKEDIAYWTDRVAGILAEHDLAGHGPPAWFRA